MKKLLLAGLCVLSASLIQAADIEAGKVKSAMCIGCHGMNGISMVPSYPNLAGQKADYLVSALKAYKSQERKGGQAAMMYGMVAALTDEDVANLAAYFASLNPAGN